MRFSRIGKIVAAGVLTTIAAATVLTFTASEDPSGNSAVAIPGNTSPPQSATTPPARPGTATASPTPSPSDTPGPIVALLDALF